MEPKDTTSNEAFKGFTNAACPFMPCHLGVEREFNCLFCYCHLSAYECPGSYKVFVDRNGLKVRRIIAAAGARLWYLPPYSPDLNPIEQAFAKIKHWMRVAQKRTIDPTWRHIGHLVGTFEPSECSNYVVNAGYASIKT